MYKWSQLPLTLPSCSAIAANEEADAMCKKWEKDDQKYKKQRAALQKIVTHEDNAYYVTTAVNLSKGKYNGITSMEAHSNRKPSLNSATGDYVQKTRQAGAKISKGLDGLMGTNMAKDFASNDDESEKQFEDKVKASLKNKAKKAREQSSNGHFADRFQSSTNTVVKKYVIFPLASPARTFSRPTDCGTLAGAKRQQRAMIPSVLPLQQRSEQQRRRRRRQRKRRKTVCVSPASGSWNRAASCQRHPAKAGPKQARQRGPRQDPKLLQLL